MINSMDIDRISLEIADIVRTRVAQHRVDVKMEDLLDVKNFIAKILDDYKDDRNLVNVDMSNVGVDKDKQIALVTNS